MCRPDLVARLDVPGIVGALAADGSEPNQRNVFSCPDGGIVLKLRHSSGFLTALRGLRKPEASASGASLQTGMSTCPETDPRATGQFRQVIHKLVESRLFRVSAMTVIILNAIALGLETSPTVMALAGPELLAFDRMVILIFCVEIGLRFVAHGLRLFRDPWGVFDVAVVAITLAPASDSLSVLRTLRVLRVLRLVSAVPRLRRVVGALLHAVPGVAAIGVLLVLIFYVYAVITTNLFGLNFPEWFGTLGASMYSLFQIMTLESWSMGLVRPILEIYPWAWLVFVSFIVVSSFTVLNLFIAIVIDSMQTMHAENKADAGVSEPSREPQTEMLLQEVRALREALDEFRAESRQQSDITRQ